MPHARLLFSALALLAPVAAVGAPKRATPKLPPTAAYTITTSAQDTESLKVEGRLAQFIRALQMGRRQKAASLLSPKVGPQARQALIQKRWIPSNARGKGEFSQVFFWKDIHIRTVRVQDPTRQLVVGPRRIPMTFGKKKGNSTGILEVRMLKDRGQWWVDMRPGKKER